MVRVKSYNKKMLQLLLLLLLMRVLVILARCRRAVLAIHHSLIPGRAGAAAYRRRRRRRGVQSSGHLAAARRPADRPRTGMERHGEAPWRMTNRSGRQMTCERWRRPRTGPSRQRSSARSRLLAAAADVGDARPSSRHDTAANFTNF